MKITAEYFESKIGSPPEHDDIERCNCKEAGDLGHFSCGWCDVCELPQFMCGCFIRGKVIEHEEKI